MASCLFVVYDRVLAVDGPGGGSAAQYSRLRSLAELGHDVHLWHYAYSVGRVAFDNYYANHREQWDDVQSLCASVELSTYPDEPSLVARIANRALNTTRTGWIANPVVRFNVARDYERLLDRFGPDLVWAENVGPGQVTTLRDRAPIVYSHHDWRSRLRADPHAEQSTTVRQQREEERIARAADAVVSGSAVECADLEHVGCTNVHYLPVAYAERSVGEPDVVRAPGIVHLGSLSTTASRVGLGAFVDKVVPHLGKSSDLVTVIGDTSAAPTALASALRHVRCLGFVDDLSSVLLPYDIHVIPWDQPTGQRTRAVAAMQHRQVIVAVSAGVACFPELEDGVNCRLVARVDDMAPVILELLGDIAQRRALGNGAAATYDRSFTIEALRSRYATVIDSVVS